MDELNWTEKGRAYLDKVKLEDGSTMSAAEVLSAIDAMEMTDPPDKLPTSIAYAFLTIREAMGYGNKSVKKFGFTNLLAPFGFLAIRYAYKDCEATSYWLDDGVSVTCLLSVKHGG